MLVAQSVLHPQSQCRKKNVELQHLLHFRKISHVNTLELCWISFATIVQENVENVGCFFFECLISMQVESKCSEEAKIVFVWFFGVLLVSKAIHILIFQERFR